MRPFVLVALLFFCCSILLLRFSVSKNTIEKNKEFVPNYIRITKETNFIDRQIKKYYPYPQSSLLSGILVGTVSQMPKNLYQQLTTTGMLHVVALSGTNISFLISSLAFLAKIIGKKAGNLLSIIFIIGFVFFVGPSPSVVRAGIMGSLFLLSELVGRSYEILYALFITAILMLIVEPQLVGSLSFQLSFCATLGMILFPPPECTFPGRKTSFINNLKMSFTETLHFTIAAQSLTIPLILYNFGQLSLISFLTNILSGWLVSYIMILGFLAVFLSLLIDTAASILPVSLVFLPQLPAILVLPFLNIFLFIVKTTSLIPFASLTFSKNTSLVLTIIYYLAFLIFLAFKKLYVFRTKVKSDTAT